MAVKELELTDSALTRTVCQCFSAVHDLYSLLRSIPPKKCMFSGRPLYPGVDCNQSRNYAPKSERTDLVGLCHCQLMLA